MGLASDGNKGDRVIRNSGEHDDSFKGTFDCVGDSLKLVAISFRNLRNQRGNRAGSCLEQKFPGDACGLALAVGFEFLLQSLELN